MYFTCDDGSQNMFVYEPTFNMIEFKKDKSPDYVTGWKLKELDNSSIAWCLLPIIKCFRKKIGIQFDNTLFIIEQNKYTKKIVNVYNVYDLDIWPKSPLTNFTLKNCLVLLI